MHGIFGVFYNTCHRKWLEKTQLAKSLPLPARGRVLGVHPPPARDYLRLSNTTGILQKNVVSSDNQSVKPFLSDNPGSAPAYPHSHTQGVNIDMCIYLFTHPDTFYKLYPSPLCNYTPLLATIQHHKLKQRYLSWFCAIVVEDLEHRSNLPVVACYDVQSHWLALLCMFFLAKPVGV